MFRPYFRGRVNLGLAKARNAGRQRRRRRNLRNFTTVSATYGGTPREPIRNQPEQACREVFDRFVEVPRVVPLHLSEKEKDLSVFEYS
jgi:hypothetical protein